MGVLVHALVDACGGLVPNFHKLAFIFRRSFSHDGSPVPVEGVAGCEIAHGGKRILILSSDGVVFLCVLLFYIVLRYLCVANKVLCGPLYHLTLLLLLYINLHIKA